MSRAVLGTTSRAVQDSSLQFRSLLSDLSALVTAVEPCETFGSEAFPPKPNGVDATTNRSGDSPLSLAFSQPKDDISTTNILGGKTAAPDFSFKFGFGFGAHFELGWHSGTISEWCIRSQCYSALGGIAVDGSVECHYEPAREGGKQPIQFQAGVRCYAEKPSGGPDWGLRFGVTFLFPK